MEKNTQRDKVKNHLEAAKEWIGSASGALENREDVKSELDLMLAEAELTRAREMKNSPTGDSSMRRRARLVRQAMRIVPLLAALAIAAVWIRFSSVTPPVKPTPPTPPSIAKPTVSAAEKPKAGNPELQQVAPAADNGAGSGYAAEKPMAGGRERNETTEAPAAPAPGVVTEGKLPQEDRTDSDRDDSNYAGAATVPSSAAQQMMLDAAKILRQTK